MFWYYTTQYGGPELVIVWGNIFWLAFFVIVVPLSIFLTAYLVDENERAIIERFGKYLRTAPPGLNFKIPVVDRVAEKLTLRIQQVAVLVETKTKDNVFVQIKLAIQYHVLGEKVYDAYYRLEDEEQQIESYVFDAVRARVPSLDLEKLFETQEEIAKAVKEELAEVMGAYGYKIVAALVTEIEPDAKVKAALNEIQAAQSLRVAAEQKGEAQRIVTVKAAQAEAEAKKLQGQGVADQRHAIVAGFKNDVQDMAQATHMEPEEVMHLILMTQYFDTLHALGMKGATTILIPHSPGVLGDLKNQLREALLPINAVPHRTNGADTAA